MENDNNCAINLIVENHIGTIAACDCIIFDNRMSVMSGDAQTTQIAIDEVNEVDHHEIQDERIPVSTI
jgi:uncharacterized protein with ACT and thioredoxin-like domain